MNPFILKNIIPKVSGGGLLPYTGAGSFAWWDPSDPGNVTKTSGRFDQINDKIGSNDITSSGSSRPYDSRTENGLELMDFQGAQYMANNFAAESHEINLIYLLKADSTTGFIYAIDSVSATNRNFNLILNGVWRIYAGTSVNGGTVTTTDFHIITVVLNGASSKIYKDGILQASGDIGSNTMEGITIGSRLNQENFLDGAVGDVFMYNAISDANRNQTAQYLSDKWGVSYTDI